MLHYTNYTLYNIINIGKIAFTIAIVEYFNSLALHKFISKTKVSHVGATCWTIYCKETQSCTRNVVEFAIGMSHQLITLLGGSI